MSGFLEHRSTSLSSDLKPDETNRLLAKDIERRQNLPFFIAGGAQKTGVVEVSYFGNASAGDSLETVSFSELGLTTQPLALVWYMGAITSGVRYPGGGLIPGSAHGTGPVNNGAEVEVTGIANYHATKDSLTVKVTSQNVGWPTVIVGHFFYALYYDKTDVSIAGL